MVKRSLSTKKYILAFFLTLVVFSGGIVVGLVLENARLQDAKQITLNEKVNLQSLQLQQNYIDSGLADCDALNKVLEVNINELTKKMGLVIDYEKKSFFNEDEFNLQLREYFLTEIQFLLASQEIDSKCKKDNVKIIYFYDESDSNTQGKILDYLKKVFNEEILVFSFNSEFNEEPMINILLTSYNIEQFPAVVIEENVFQGHTSVEKLMVTICKEMEKAKTNIPSKCKTILEKLSLD